MELNVLGSGSHGNCYVLKSNTGESLIIEAGIKINRVKKFFNFDLSNISGVLVSHSHLDHSKAMKDFTQSAINVYSGAETIKEMDLKSHRLKPIEPKKAYKIGSFKVVPLGLRHDVFCLGFVIQHEECGNVVFLTDTYYSPFRFKNIHNWIIEANYSQDIMDGKDGYANTKMFLRNRVMTSHMSIENCLDMLDINDLSVTNNIVLTHLSDRNSHAEQFKSKTENQTGKTVTIAETGLTIPFNKKPF